MAHLYYRRAIHEGRAHAVPYRMPGAPAANWLVLGMLIVVAILLAFDPETRVALYIAPIWFALLALGYFRIDKPAAVPNRR